MQPGSTSTNFYGINIRRDGIIALPGNGILDNRERSPQGRAHTRDSARPLRLPRDQEISDSILDTILNKLLYRRRSILPDSFETFLRARKEITLADIYHTLNEKSAVSFDGLVWFAVSLQG